MVGNIANPQTYQVLSDLGADYIRVTIGNGCFTPNMKIKTKNEIKTIYDVQIGEYIKTHKNRYKKVIDKYKYYKNENLIIINNKIECTKKHEFYVVYKKDREKITEKNYQDFAFWISVNKLDKDVHLLIEI